MNRHAPHPNIDPRRLDAALLMLRVMLGAVFVFHGGQKLFGWFDGNGIMATATYMESIGIPAPMASAVLVGALELFGGIAIATGAGFHTAALPLAFTMIVATFAAHVGFDASHGGGEYPLTLAVVLTAMALTGPGSVTLPRRLARRREAPGRRRPPAMAPARA